jgi:hypothetical protein
VAKTIQPDAWHVAQPSLLTGLALVLARGVRWLVAPERPIVEDLVPIGVGLVVLFVWRHVRRRRFSLVFDGM